MTNFENQLRIYGANAMDLVTLVTSFFETQYRHRPTCIYSRYRK